LQTLLKSTNCYTARNISGADAGYTGVKKRPEHEDREVIWQIAARRRENDRREVLAPVKNPERADDLIVF